MTYTLTEEQFERLLDYFHKAAMAVSNDEVDEVLSLDAPLLEMLREIREEQG